VARALGDVLHLFDPELAPAPRGPRPALAPALPIAGVAVPAGDLLRLGAAFNLAVELARLGQRAGLVAGAAGTPLGAADEAAALGARLGLVEDADPSAVLREGRALARRLAEDGARGLVLACLGPDALEAALAGGELDRILLLTPGDRAGLAQTGALIRRLFAARADARVGVTVHGVRSIAEAREAFDRLATALEREIGRTITSYGLLVDDLALYRSLVERRPVATGRHQSPAARALADVARLLAEDIGP
jgi:hypothetical protein